jgi:hypothetical protein
MLGEAVSVTEEAECVLCPLKHIIIEVLEITKKLCASGLLGNEIDSITSKPSVTLQNKIPRASKYSYLF